MILMLLSLVFLPTISSAGNEKEAIEKASLAAYKQSGIEDSVNKFVDLWTPKIIKEYGGNLMFIKQAAIDKQISYKWEF